MLVSSQLIQDVVLVQLILFLMEQLLVPIVQDVKLATHQQELAPNVLIDLVLIMEPVLLVIHLNILIQLLSSVMLVIHHVKHVV